MSKSRHPWYHKWRNWIDYTTNPNIATYRSQGALGIKVAKYWYDFDTFVEDIESLPRGPGCDQLTRIDASKDYRRGNICWDTRKGYANRRTDCVYIQYQGQRRNVAQWIDHLGISPSTVYQRLGRGWTHLEALELKPRKKV